MPLDLSQADQVEYSERYVALAEKRDAAVRTGNHTEAKRYRQRISWLFLCYRGKQLKPPMHSEAEAELGPTLHDLLAHASALTIVLVRHGSFVSAEAVADLVLQTKDKP